MKRYKLLKDTPTIKAGTIFEEVVSDYDGAKELVRITPVGAKTNPQWTIRDIDNFDEWFEETQEPTDSIHWKPRIGDRCFIIENASIRPTSYTGMLHDYNAWRTGKTFRTEEECEKALKRELVETRVRRTSAFKPDFKMITAAGLFIITLERIGSRYRKSIALNMEKLYATRLRKML